MDNVWFYDSKDNGDRITLVEKDEKIRGKKQGKRIG